MRRSRRLREGETVVVAVTVVVVRQSVFEAFADRVQLVQSVVTVVEQATALPCLIKQTANMAQIKKIVWMLMLPSIVVVDS